jgi:hypothetical protein
MHHPAHRARPRALTLLVMIAAGVVGGTPAVLAQAPVIGATQVPSMDPADVRVCPVSLGQASALTGVPMQPDPMYATSNGGMYVQHGPRAPGLEDETTIFTCAYLSEATDGRAYGAHDQQLFLSFVLGDDATWLWDLNGPGIVADPSYVALVDDDPATPDSYRRTTSFEADGEALVVPRWEVRDRLHSDGLFADIIVSAAGDTRSVHDHVALVASLVGLAIVQATAP